MTTNKTSAGNELCAGAVGDSLPTAPSYGANLQQQAPNMTDTATDAVEVIQASMKFGAAMFDAVWGQFVCGDFEIEINDLITVDAVQAGLVEKVPFDPDQHTDDSGACVPGDDYWHITYTGRELLAIARGAATPSNIGDVERLRDLASEAYRQGYRDGVEDGTEIGEEPFVDGDAMADGWSNFASNCAALSPPISAPVDTGRNTVLEEAARLAEGYEEKGFDTGIARAIRARKSQPPASDAGREALVAYVERLKAQQRETNGDMLYYGTPDLELDRIIAALSPEREERGDMA